MRQKMASHPPKSQATSNTNAPMSHNVVDPLPKSISSEQTTRPGAFHETFPQEDGRLNIFEERIRQKRAAQPPHSSATKDIIQQSGVIGSSQNAQLRKSKSIDQRSTTETVHETEISASNLFNKRLNAKVKGEEIPPVHSNEHSNMEKTHEAPGAKQVTDSHFNKIIERKLENANSETKRIHHQGDLDQLRYRDDSVTGTSNVLDSDTRLELLEIKKAGNCDDIIGFLRVNANVIPVSTIILAFECIREAVCGNYKESAISTVFRSKVSWLKIFSSLMYTHFSNEVVQFEALRTLWAIASLSPRHVMDITSNDEILESIVDVMEEHSSEAVHEYGSGLIACLAVSHTHALNLLDCCDGQIVQRLMAALLSPSRNGTAQIYSLRALCRLSSAVLCSEKCEYFFGDEMGRFVTNGQFAGCPSANSVVALLNVMQQYANQLSLLIEGSRLLCQIFTRDAMAGDVFSIVAKKVVHHFENILAVHSHCSVLHETTIYLLSNISYWGSETIEEPISFTTKVLSIMSANANSSIIALHGCRSIYNLCASEQMKKDVRATFASFGGIHDVIKFMSTFPKHVDIQGEACGALFAVCCESPINKRKVMESGGIDAIVSSFEVNSGLIDPTEDDSLSFLIRACAVLLTLSVDPCALKEIEKRGIIQKFCLLLKDGATVPESLRLKMQELVNMALDNEPPPFCFENELNEEETSDCLLVNLKAILPPNKVDSKKSILLQSNTIIAMQKFPSSVEIQATGCKILSCIFGSTTNASCKGLDAALSCICSKHSSLVVASASVFRNFCLMQSSVQLDVYEAQCLSNTLVRSSNEFVNAIQAHKTDQNVCQQVLSALWAIASAEKGVVLSFESKEFVDLILNFMKSRCTGIQRNCLGLLYEFFCSTAKIMDFLTENLILAIVDCLQSDEKDVAGVAISTAWIISERGAFPARMMMLDHHEKLIGAVVECMFKFPQSPLIIRASCDILSNISLDNYYRLAITSSGGTGRVNDALVEFNTDDVTACKALISLTNLISGADVDVLCMNDVAKNILQAMSTHKEALHVQVNGASAIWHLASRDDMFKDILVEIGAVRHLSHAMTRFIASQTMTRKGLVAIWSLSVPRNLKAEVGLDGLVPVLNGLSAHLSSEKVCEEGLGALKSLSTVNKEMLDENDAIDMIYSCMWLHSHNSSIQQASFAALVNLSVNLETNQVSRITCEDLDTIVNIMRIHQSSKAVQENAIILLRNFTFSPHNCRILRENNFLVGLIHTAMRNFRDTFQGRAEDLLRVLPQDSKM
eukprot:CCRYP_001351-RA/>CCRYP_001351-RA protein AED:0.01 eAED:0.01 QI:1729/1/1/1/1/1/4/62/1276